MSNRSLVRRILGLMGRIRSAGRAAAAVESRRSPSPSDLERLGISVVAFGAINKN
jgi:hypothetical protein